MCVSYSSTWSCSFQLVMMIFLLALTIPMLGAESMSLSAATTRRESSVLETTIQPHPSSVLGVLSISSGKVTLTSAQVLPQSPPSISLTLATPSPHTTPAASNVLLPPSSALVMRTTPFNRNTLNISPSSTFTGSISSSLTHSPTEFLPTVPTPATATPPSTATFSPVATSSATMTFSFTTSQKTEFLPSLNATRSTAVDAGSMTLTQATPEVTPTSLSTEMSTPPPVGTESTEGRMGSSSTDKFPLAAIIGITIGGTVTIMSLSLTILLVICFCCCCIRSKKYEYSTGNEYRMTVQQWNMTSAHYNMNRADSVSSVASSRSRGSSFFGSFGFTRRYSNSADHVSSVGNPSVPDLYSTPL